MRHLKQFVAYTEDQLVEQPAIGLFAELGWQTVSAMEESFGVTGTLQRETKGEVVLRGTCDRSRLLDLVENFTLFSEHKAGLVKIIGQNHQY